MSGEATTGQPIPPGRPGNLTPEQEELLRKLWSRIFDVCGVSYASGESTPEPEKPEPAAAPAEADKKKSRLGFFSRKSKKDADKPDASAAANGANEADPEDKYGQNQIFEETLKTMSPETIRATIWSMVKLDHPDALLLRFLRARKWDVERALVMLVSAMSWRHRDVKVDDDIILRGEEGMLVDSQSDDADAKKLGEGFMAQLRMGKSILHGVDKDGRPVCLVRVRLHFSKDQSVASLERYTVYLIETARLVLKPPVDTATIVFDMTGFQLANMDYTPIRYMIKCFEANFPESLGHIIVHKAPWVFQGIYKIIKAWLDPVVAAKVHFTHNLSDISEYIAVDKIPKEIEGAEDWEYAYTEPVPGENDTMKDTATRDELLRQRAVLANEYEEATKAWLRHPADEVVKAKRNSLAAQLREQYWVLDPYIRARSWYDRIGVIKPKGVIDYYPTTVIDAEKQNGSVAATSAAVSALSLADNGRAPLADVTNGNAATPSAENEKVAATNGTEQAKVGVA